MLHPLELCALTLVVACLGCHAQTSTPASVSADGQSQAASAQPATDEACVYAGTLVTRGDVYATPTGDEVLYTLRGDAFAPDSGVHVARLEPPHGPGLRAKIEITAPVAISGWLDGDAKPLAAARPLTLVEGSIWLDRSYEVSAHDLDDGSLRVSEPLPEGQGLEIGLETMQWRVPCDALMLSDQGGFIGPTGAEGDAYVDLGEGKVEMFAAPDGEVIGRVRGGIWMVVEERDGWVHVAESEPVHVDVWVPASSVVEPSDPSTIDSTSGFVESE